MQSLARRTVSISCRTRDWGRAPALPRDWALAPCLFRRVAPVSSWAHTSSWAHASSRASAVALHSPRTSTANP